eukprot:3567112-Prymnesium_polylepis.1
MGVDTWALGVLDVYDVLRTVLQQQLGPSAPLGVQELHSVSRRNGWLTSFGWQVPASSVSEQDSSTSERRRSIRGRA